MGNLLIKLFIKNPDDTGDETVRQQYGMLGGAVGIALNVVVFCIKLFAGLLSASVAIVADALNNLSDALSSVITLIGFKMSGKPADRQHPFGHGRIEYISALFVSIAILYMGIELVRSSFDKIMNAEPIVVTAASVFILVVSILLKTWMYFFNRKIGKKISSQSMAATAKDSLSDSIATAAVLIGVLISYFTGYTIDGYIGLIVSAFILWTGYTTIRDSLTPLLGQAPDPELVKEIEQLVLSHEGVIGMHDLIIHNYGPTRFMLSLHAEVSADENVVKMHDTIDLIEKELQTHFKCDAVIHMDPIETNNTLINQTKQFVEDVIHSISSELSLHDFRMVTGPTHTNLIFDLVVPFDFQIKDDDLKQMIQDKVAARDSFYCTVINIDKNYIG